MDVIALESFDGNVLPKRHSKKSFKRRLKFKKPFSRPPFHRNTRVFEINRQILNRHRSKAKKKYFPGIHYNICVHEISTKLNHYFDNCYLLPKFSESRRNSPICQAIKYDIPTRELLNFDHNPQRFGTFSMFAEHHTANSPLSKQLLRVTSIAGGPELQNRVR